MGDYRTFCFSLVNVDLRSIIVLYMRLNNCTLAVVGAPPWRPGRAAALLRRVSGQRISRGRAYIEILSVGGARTRAAFPYGGLLTSDDTRARLLPSPARSHTLGATRSPHLVPLPPSNTDGVAAAVGPCRPPEGCPFYAEPPPSSTEMLRWPCSPILLPAGSIRGDCAMGSRTEPPLGRRLPSADRGASAMGCDGGSRANCYRDRDSNPIPHIDPVPPSASASLAPGPHTLPHSHPLPQQHSPPASDRFHPAPHHRHPTPESLSDPMARPLPDAKPFPLSDAKPFPLPDAKPLPLPDAKPLPPSGEAGLDHRGGRVPGARLLILASDAGVSVDTF